MWRKGDLAVAKATAAGVEPPIVKGAVFRVRNVPIGKFQCGSLGEGLEFEGIKYFVCEGVEFEGVASDWFRKPVNGENEACDEEFKRLLKGELVDAN